MFSAEYRVVKTIEQSALFVLYFVAILVLSVRLVSAETLSGGNYVVNADLTSVSAGATQGGGNFSVSARSDSAGGGLSAGNFAVQASTPGASGQNNTSNSSSGASYGSGVMKRPELLITALSVVKTDNSATITVNFNKEVAVKMFYGLGATTLTTDVSAKAKAHTCLVENLSPDIKYNFAFDAQFDLSDLGSLSSTLPFSGFSFKTLALNAEKERSFSATTTSVSIPENLSDAKEKTDNSTKSKNALTIPVIPYGESYDNTLNADSGSGNIKRTILKGFVTDTNDFPVDGAVIELLIKTKDVPEHLTYIKTDNKGEYSVYVPKGEYLMIVNHDNYDTLSTELEVDDTESVTNIVLNKSYSIKIDRNVYKKAGSCDKSIPTLVLLIVVFGLIGYAYVRIKRNETEWLVFVALGGVALLFAVFMYIFWC